MISLEYSLATILDNCKHCTCFDFLAGRQPIWPSVLGICNGKLYFLRYIGNKIDWNRHNGHLENIAYLVRTPLWRTAPQRCLFGKESMHDWGKRWWSFKHFVKSVIFHHIFPFLLLVYFGGNSHGITIFYQIFGIWALREGHFMKFWQNWEMGRNLVNYSTWMLHNILLQTWIHNKNIYCFALYLGYNYNIQCLYNRQSVCLTITD